MASAARESPESSPPLNRKLKLLGVGQPLLDIIARVDSEFLSSRNLAADGMILQSSNELASTIFEDISALDCNYVAGGATLNSIRLAASILGGSHRVGFVGSIGRDDCGNRIEHLVSNQGISTAFYRAVSKSTGKCAVLVNSNEERSMVTSLGAAAEFPVSHFHSEHVLHLFREYDIIYSSGFFARLMPAEMQTFIQNKKKIFCLNTSAAWAVSDLGKLFPMADFIFGNGSEFQAIEPSKTLQEIASDLSLLQYQNATGSRVVIITNGSEATILAQNGEVKLFPVEQLLPEDIVDTNGAGDAFVAGFLSCYANGGDLKTCMKTGHLTAKRIIQAVGVPEM